MVTLQGKHLIRPEKEPMKPIKIRFLEVQNINNYTYYGSNTYHLGTTSSGFMSFGPIILMFIFGNIEN